MSGSTPSRRTDSSAHDPLPDADAQQATTEQVMPFVETCHSVSRETV